MTLMIDPDNFTAVEHNATHKNVKKTFLSNQKKIALFYRLPERWIDSETTKINNFFLNTINHKITGLLDYWITVLLDYWITVLIDNLITCLLD